MKRVLILSLSTALVAGCGSPAPGTHDAPRSENRATATALAVDREVTIPFGTTLSLVLTNSIASDSSTVEDPVTAELTRSITIDGLDVLPAGTPFTGIVTEVDNAGRSTGRAMIRFRLNSLRTRNTVYSVETLSRL